MFFDDQLGLHQFQVVIGKVHAQIDTDIFQQAIRPDLTIEQFAADTKIAGIGDLRVIVPLDPDAIAPAMVIRSQAPVAFQFDLYLVPVIID